MMRSSKHLALFLLALALAPLALAAFADLDPLDSDYARTYLLPRLNGKRVPPFVHKNQEKREKKVMGRAQRRGAVSFLRKPPFTRPSTLFHFNILL